MTSRFIVAEVQGEYHVLYKVPNTNVHSSVGYAPSESLAQAECDLLNAEQEKHDQETGV